MAIFAAIAVTVSGKASTVNVLGRGVDTAKTFTIYQPAQLKGVTNALPSWEDHKKQQVTGEKRTDTTTIFLQEPRMGAGIGWSLGGFELFTKWEKGLPDSLQDFQLSPVLSGSDWGSMADDTGYAILKINHIPEAYNVNFPLSFTWTPFVRNAYAIDLRFCCFAAWKTWLAALHVDSLSFSTTMKHRMAFGSISTGVSLNYAIPPRWFSINNVDGGFFHVGVAFHPLSAMSLRTSLSHTASSSDSLRPLKVLLENATRGRLAEMRAFGLGFSWRFGITTISSPAEYKGIMFDFGYEGQWFGAFLEQGKVVKIRRINPTALRGNDPLSSVNHRLVLHVHFLWGLGKHAPAPSP